MSTPSKEPRNVVTHPWTREELLGKLWKFRANRSLERAMVQLLARQTVDERYAETTKHTNGMGFSAFHAKTGTKLGKYAQDPANTYGPVWQRKAFNIIKVHIGQLVEIANTPK
jgi:hypothetical protein